MKSSVAGWVYGIIWTTALPIALLIFAVLFNVVIDMAYGDGFYSNNWWPGHLMAATFFIIVFLCGLRLNVLSGDHPRKLYSGRHRFLFVPLQIFSLGCLAAQVVMLTGAESMLSNATRVIAESQGSLNEAVDKKALSASSDCDSDLQCMGDRYSPSAGVYCQEPVEKLAKYGFRWTDGVLETKFSRFRWLDQNKKIIVFMGDRIEFQNGFGAFANHTYECIYDPENDKVLGAQASPGRF